MVVLIVNNDNNIIFIKSLTQYGEIYYRQVKHMHIQYTDHSQPLCRWWLNWPIHNDAKNLKKDWNFGTWVIIWEYWARSIQWMPTWQGLDGFKKYLHPCALDVSIASALEELRELRETLQQSICTYHSSISSSSIEVMGSQLDVSPCALL